MPAYCICSGGFTGEWCGTEDIVGISSSAPPENDEASNAGWAALAILPLMVAAAYFHKTRSTSGKAALGGIDFETAYDTSNRRSSFEAVATAMLAADPVAFEVVIDKLATEGLRAERPSSTGQSLSFHAEVPIMMSNDITAESAAPAAAAAPAPVALLMSPEMLRVMHSDDGDLKRSRSYGDALNTVSFGETEPAAAGLMFSSPPALVQMAMAAHRPPDIVVDNDAKTLRFKSVKRTNPLYAAQQQNRGVQILEDDDALFSELDHSVQNAVEGSNAADESVGSVLVGETAAGTTIFGAQREYQRSPHASESITSGLAAPVGYASTGGQSNALPDGEGQLNSTSPTVSTASRANQSGPFIPDLDAMVVASDGTAIAVAARGTQSSRLASEDAVVSVDGSGVSSAKKAVLTRQSTDWGLLAPAEGVGATDVLKAGKGLLIRQATDWGLSDGGELQPAEAIRQGEAAAAPSTVAATSVAGTELYRSSVLSNDNASILWEDGAASGVDGPPVMVATQGTTPNGRPHLFSTATLSSLPTTPTTATSGTTIWIDQGDEDHLRETDGDAISFAERAGSPLGRSPQSSTYSASLTAAIPLAHAREALQRTVGGVSTGASSADQTASGVVVVQGISADDSSPDRVYAAQREQTLQLSDVPTDSTDADSTHRGSASNQGGAANLSETSPALLFAVSKALNSTGGGNGGTAEDVEEFVAWFAAREAQFVADDKAATEAAEADLEHAGLESTAISEGTALDAAKKAVVVSPSENGGGGGGGSTSSNANDTAALFRAHLANNGDQFESMPVEQIVDSDLFRSWLASRYQGAGAPGDAEMDAVYSAHQVSQAFDAAEAQAGGSIDGVELDAVYNAHRGGHTFDRIAEGRQSTASASSNVLHPDLYKATGEANIELATELPVAFFGMREAMITDFAAVANNNAATTAGEGGLEAAPTTPALFVAEKGSQPPQPWSPTGTAMAAAAAVGQGAAGVTAHVSPGKEAAHKDGGK